MPPSDVARSTILNGTGDRGVFALLHPDRQHAAEAARHLPQRDVVTGVALDAGIEHRR